MQMVVGASIAAGWTWIVWIHANPHKIAMWYRNNAGGNVHWSGPHSVRLQQIRVDVMIMLNHDNIM
jgi:hypothetical protein